MTNTDVVKKLIGNVQPYGATHIDNERFENLKAMCKLVNELVTEIDTVSYKNKDRHEHSMKQMADYASNFLSNTLGIVESNEKLMKQLELLLDSCDSNHALEVVGYKRGVLGAIDLVNKHS
jgi:hypothetical protein